METGISLARALGVSPELFFEDANVKLPSKSLDSLFFEVKQKFEALEMVEIPIRGSIPAGYPCIKEEENDGYAYVARESIKHIQDTGKLFALVVQGESLIGDHVYPGDRLLVRPQSEVDVPGKIYICRIGNECTAKHVIITPEGKYRLHAANDHFEDFEPAELEILGRALRNLGKDQEL